MRVTLDLVDDDVLVLLQVVSVRPHGPSAAAAAAAAAATAIPVVVEMLRRHVGTVATHFGQKSPAVPNDLLKIFSFDAVN